MNQEERILKIAYMNIQGQTNLPLPKQLQIEDFVKYNKIDILHIQEIEVNDETFFDCNFLSTSYNISSNKSLNKYVTASLIRSDLPYTNVRCDTAGRAIIFDIGDVTFGNIYAHSGTNGVARANRENFCSEIIPSLLINCKPSGCLGGDFNMIIDSKDATTHPSAKMSPSFKKLVQVFKWKDSYRSLHPSAEQFSRYYGSIRGEGATRIDRSYHYGDIQISSAIYLPIAFSDHHTHVVTAVLPNPFKRLMCPKGNYSFRIKSEVVNDGVFQERLKESMEGWQNIRSFGMDVLVWWENIVKPGVKKLAQQRGREMTKLSREELNLFRLRQGYLNRKLLLGQFWQLTELKAIHLRIEQWYAKESNKIKHQSQADEYQSEEKVRVYHHEIHRKRVRKSSILKLETSEGVLEGHRACSSFLEKSVQDLLLHPVQLCKDAQAALLDEVDLVFTDKDNEKLCCKPTRKEVLDTLSASNLHAAPGTDGLTSYFYKKSFDIMGDPLTDVVTAVFSGSKPTLSMRTSKMVFGCK